MKKHILATRVGQRIYKSVQFVSNRLDISRSEYVRNVILSDLENRNVLDIELDERSISEESG